MLPSGRNMYNFKVLLRVLCIIVTTQSLLCDRNQLMHSLVLHTVMCEAVIFICIEEMQFWGGQKWQISWGNIRFPKHIILIACIHQTGFIRCLKCFRASRRDKNAFQLVGAVLSCQCFLSVNSNTNIHHSRISKLK